MDLSSLNHLLSAPSKVAIDQAMTFAFISRHQSMMSTSSSSSFNNTTNEETKSSYNPLTKFRDILGLNDTISVEETLRLRAAMLDCINCVVLSGKIEDLGSLFQTRGQNVNPKLQQLIGQVIISHVEAWREAANTSRISLPKLQDFDWSLHFQRASSELSDIQIPSVLMSLTVEDLSNSTHKLPDSRQIQFELSREALETMIDGLGKIRDQLQNMK